MKNKIIIIGGNHHNTLSMVRSLGEKYLYIDVIIENSYPKECFVSKSKYVNKCFYANEESEILDILKKYYFAEKQKPVIITCSDKSATVLDNNYDILIKHFYFFNGGKQGGISNYLLKQNQVKLASELGINTPLSIVYTNGNEFREEIQYPCLLKPLSSTFLAKRADICNNQNEMKNILNEYPIGCMILIQEYIDREYEIVVDGVSVKNDVFIPGYIRKLRDNINGGGSFTQSFHVNTLPISLVEKLANLVRKLHYEGLFGIDIIYSKGVYYFLEINLRNDATTYSLVKSGVNLPEIFVETVTSKNNNFPNEFEIHSIYSMCELGDFSNSLKIYHNSVVKWIKDVLKTECFFLYDKEDFLPFRKIIFNYVCRQVKKIKK